MNVNIKKLISTSLIFVLAILVLNISHVSLAAEKSSIDVVIKGNHLDMKVEPILKENRIYIPIRDFAESLDLKVEWIAKQNTAKLSNLETTILIPIGQKEIYINGKKINLDEKSFIKKEKAFIPLRSVAEALSQKVTWDQKNRIVIVGEFSHREYLEDAFVYTNEEHKYTMSFPKSWEGQFELTQDKNTLVISSKVNEIERLGSIHRYTDLEWKNLNYGYDIPVEYEILNQNSSSIFIITYPSDVSYNLENKNSVKKYEEMSNDLRKKNFTFNIIETKNILISANKEMYKKEIEVLDNILEYYVPKNIFNKDEIFTYQIPQEDIRFLYMRNMKSDDEVEIKIEIEFDKKGNIIRYHLKNYSFDLKENKLSQNDALKLANEFANKYVDENIKLKKIPGLYPSLYQEDSHETYGNESGNYIVVVDLQHGFVEYFSYNNM